MRMGNKFVGAAFARMRSKPNSMELDVVLSTSPSPRPAFSAVGSLFFLISILFGDSLFAQKDNNVDEFDYPPVFAPS